MQSFCIWPFLPKNWLIRIDCNTLFRIVCTFILTVDSLTTHFSTHFQLCPVNRCLIEVLQSGATPNIFLFCCFIDANCIVFCCSAAAPWLCGHHRQFCFLGISTKKDKLKSSCTLAVCICKADCVCIRLVTGRCKFFIYIFWKSKNTWTHQNKAVLANVRHTDLHLLRQ